MMTHDITLCGWRVSSELELTEALPWQGDRDTPADITVKFGDVPEKLENRITGGLISNVTADGTYLMRMPNVGRFLVTNGTTITVQPECALDKPDLRLPVQTGCLSALAWQRGYIPFHGSVVKIGDQTIGLLGVSGIGKSSLAMTLIKRRHTFLAEENCITYKNPEDNNALYVLPTLPDLRLWRDVLNELNIPVDGLAHNRAGQEKYHNPQPQAFEDTPQPLSAMILLSQHATVADGIAHYRRLRGAESIGRLGKGIQKRVVGRALGQGEVLLNRCVDIATTLGAFALTSQKGVSNIHTVADQIEEIAASLPNRSTLR